MRPRRLRLRRFRPILRPRAGERLARELRPGRVGQLAAALPMGIADPGFEVLLRRIDRAPVLGGNEVEVYLRGEDAFAAMQEATRAAEREILAESYIVKDDLIGRALRRELAAAAARGLDVRLLADAVGSFATRAAYWDGLRAGGVDVRLYHPLFPHLWYQPFRDHRKIFVADRRVAFTGGMNFGDEYGSPRSQPGQNWRDTHVRVSGPAAWEMAVVFSEGWQRAGGGALELQPLPAERAEAPGARILVLDSRPGRGHEETASVLAAIVGAARHRVWITNAYFAPGHAAVRILGRAARRGVDVRLLLPGQTDVPLVRHAAHGYYRRLLAAGVRIWEYQAAVLHAKTLVADGLISVIGSTNLDFRSFVFNAECNLAILDPPTAAVLEEAFETDLEQAEEIRPAVWRRRTTLHRLSDGLARWLTPFL